MENIDFATLFQGIGTMMASGWVLASARVFLVLLGLLLIYLGWKGILEPMVMIPMGLGMVAINLMTAATKKPMRNVSPIIARVDSNK
jgi:carboxybiotin decarboxylase